MKSTSVRQFLNSRFPKLRDNIAIIDNPEKLEVTDIQNGVLIVYASWSGQSVINCITTIHFLYDQDYSDK